MATYTRETRVRAPLEDVWAFHSTLDGLEALTPAFMHLEVRSVTGPDGEPNPDELLAGTSVDLAIRPFGVGPRRTWTTRITDREADENAALFRDVMEDGPFPRWIHTHRFVADGDATVVSDHVAYELPGGVVGRALSPLGRLGFGPMFRARHRKTRELLE
jgi:ligand-binding SRPBCC domain-containing protein